MFSDAYLLHSNTCFRLAREPNGGTIGMANASFLIRPHSGKGLPKTNIPLLGLQCNSDEPELYTAYIPLSYKGSTTDFDSVGGGSIPSSGATCFVVIGIDPFIILQKLRLRASKSLANLHQKVSAEV